MESTPEEMASQLERQTLDQKKQFDLIRAQQKSINSLEVVMMTLLVETKKNKKVEQRKEKESPGSFQML